MEPIGWGGSVVEVYGEAQGEGECEERHCWISIYRQPMPNSPGQSR